MQAIVSWLSLPRPSEIEWEAIMQREANRGHSQSAVEGCSGERPDMLPATRRLLQGFYEPLNGMLAAQLGERYDWAYTQTAE